MQSILERNGGGRGFFRRIARRGDTQARWKYCKETGKSFFPNTEAGSELTYEQLYLIHWITLYETIYNMDEPRQPDKITLENDERLDEWLAVKREERRQFVIEQMEREWKAELEKKTKRKGGSTIG